MDPSDAELKKTEWFFVLAILIFVLCAAIISQQTSFSSLSKFFNIKKEKLTVEISGSVRRPGQYSVLPGTCWRSVLRKAKAKPLADLSQIDLDQIISANGALHIPELEKLNVLVTGSVERPQAVVAPAGCRICDLPAYIELRFDADRSFFRSKRRLKNNEIVNVPKRREKEGVSG